MIDYDSAHSDGLWGEDRHLAPNGNPEGDSSLDPGIYEIVWGLHEAGVETMWSCQGGGAPHAYIQRMVGFGLMDEAAGPKALAAAQALGMPILYLHRVLCVGNDMDEGTFWWELIFDRFVEWKRP